MKKPLHKHIGRHAKNVKSQFTKYLYERDTIFATIWVFLFIVILGAIPLNLGSMNPIKLGLKDFDFNDLYYSKLGKSAEKDQNFDSRIVIVNIEQADREGLSYLIDKVGSLNPKVMALDVLFYEEKDFIKDSLLRESFERNKNLVAATQVLLSGKDGDTIKMSGNYFNTASTYAYVNLFNDSFATVRSHTAFIKDYAGKEYKSFPSAVVEVYDKEKYEMLKKKGDKKIAINYGGSVSRYIQYTFGQVMNEEVDDSAFAGKIVLLGYLNPDRNDITDKFFTPMNDRFYGKSVPDMNGIAIHANIISMALDGSYIKKLPLWLNLLIAVVVCWLHMSFFIRYYLESHIWFHLVAKIAQVASAILFVWLGIYLFNRYQLKVDLKYSLITIVLAVDVIYFYEAWAIWMHKKFNYKTVFKPHHN